MPRESRQPGSAKPLPRVRSSPVLSSCSHDPGTRKGRDAQKHPLPGHGRGHMAPEPSGGKFLLYESQQMPTCIPSWEESGTEAREPAVPAEL